MSRRDETADRGGEVLGRGRFGGDFDEPRVGVDFESGRFSGVVGWKSGPGLGDEFRFEFRPARKPECVRTEVQVYWAYGSADQAQASLESPKLTKLLLPAQNRPHSILIESQWIGF